MQKLTLDPSDFDGYVWEPKIICPKDPSATPERIRQYESYYGIKYAIAKKLRPTRIVEIGVRAGYSAWAFCRACPKAYYIGYDAENGQHGGFGGPWTWWAKRLLNGREFSLYAPFDTQTHKTLPEIGDFYHIDGDHTKDGVIHDLDLCFRRLDNNGFILVDDYDYKEAGGVREGVDDWLSKNDVRALYYPSLRGEILIGRK